MPSIPGIAMSINTTSGFCSRTRSTALRPSTARPTTSMRASVERIASSASAKRRWSSAMTTRTLSAISPRLWTMDEAAARAKIHDLLVTGDNRLKQGVDLAKVRESYERALDVAREHGLEAGVAPLVEVRLADLDKLEAESPPPVPPAA